MKPKTSPPKKSHRIRPRKKTLEERYNMYFKPLPAVPADNDEISLEQPTPFKIFPTETTYGISDCMFA